MTTLEVHTSRHGERVTVSVIGPITHHTTSTLREHLRPLFGLRPGTEVAVDLRCCTAVDTDGFLALDVARQSANTRGLSLFLVRVPPLIERLIHQYNLAHLLTPGRPGDEADEPGGVRPPGDAGMRGPDAEVPEADRLEQQLPVDTTDAVEPDDSYSPISAVPMEADPADVFEQAQPVPLDDEDRDDNDGST